MGLTVGAGSHAIYRFIHLGSARESDPGELDGIDEIDNHAALTIAPR